MKTQILNELRDEAYNTSKSKGWYDKEPQPTFGDRIALVHSELSEALEVTRTGAKINESTYEKDGKPVGVDSELADVIIRVLDMCGFYNIDIARAVEEKLNYNKTRSYRHGNKTL